MAKGLVSQLINVFALLQNLAIHRDVSSHNVLIDIGGDGEEDAPKAHFSLIDFGLSVRAGSWHREWSSSNLAGDPRYWAPPAWMAFAFGFRYLETHPNRGFLRQYLVRIDHFSLGVLGLETLFALWDHEGEPAREAGTMRQVREAWCEYWLTSLKLFQLFHGTGQTETRNAISRSAELGMQRITTQLRQVRHTLRAAAGDPANLRLASFLRVLADLIDERGTLTWGQLPQALQDPSVTALTISTPSAVKKQVGAVDNSGGAGGSMPRCMSVPIIPLVNGDGVAINIGSVNISTHPPVSPGRSRREEGALPEVVRYGTGGQMKAVFEPAAPLDGSSRADMDQQQKQQFGMAEAQRLSGWNVSTSSPGVPYVPPAGMNYSCKPRSYVPPDTLLSTVQRPSYTPPLQQSASYVPLPVTVSNTYGGSSVGGNSWVPSVTQTSQTGGYPGVTSSIASSKAAGTSSPTRSSGYSTQRNTGSFSMLRFEH
jgi:serine/threonine protein kinase